MTTPTPDPHQDEPTRLSDLAREVFDLIDEFVGGIPVAEVDSKFDQLFPDLADDEAEERTSGRLNARQASGADDRVLRQLLHKLGADSACLDPACLDLSPSRARRPDFVQAAANTAADLYELNTIKLMARAAERQLRDAQRQLREAQAAEQAARVAAAAAGTTATELVAAAERRARQIQEEAEDKARQRIAAAELEAQQLLEAIRQLSKNLGSALEQADGRFAGGRSRPTTLIKPLSNLLDDCCDWDVRVAQWRNRNHVLQGPLYELPGGLTQGFDGGERDIRGAVVGIRFVPSTAPYIYVDGHGATDPLRALESFGLSDGSIVGVEDVGKQWGRWEQIKTVTVLGACGAAPLDAIPLVRRRLERVACNQDLRPSVWVPTAARQLDVVLCGCERRLERRLPTKVSGRTISQCEDMLRVRMRQLGDEHPETLMSVHVLATAYRTIGDIDRAIPLYQQALHGFQRVLGERHPQTLAAKIELGGALSK